MIAALACAAVFGPGLLVGLWLVACSAVAASRSEHASHERYSGFIAELTVARSKVRP